MTENRFDKMRGELRRGVLVLSVLASLEQPHYGYSLRKQLLDAGIDIDEGTLYPLVRRLADQGLLDSEWRQAEGRAVPQVAGKTDKLWVTFDNWFSNLLPGVAKGDYWVLYVDDDYRTALVGNPNRKYLWLLTREQKVTAAQRDKLLEVARSQGYDTDALIWRSPNAAIRAPR